MTTRTMKYRLRIGLAAGLLLASAALADETAGSDGSATESATFSMYCYWTGEATLGLVDGVVASRIGHWGGAEIVQVDYDPERTDLGELTRALRRQRSFDALLVSDGDERERAASQLRIEEIDIRRGGPRFIEPKHSLRTRHPQLLELGLSERQAIALNSWSYFGGPMPDVLSDEQKRLLASR